MKQDNSMSDSNGPPRQESCSTCNGGQTFSRPAKSSRAQCSQCGNSRSTGAAGAPKDEASLQPRTLYVSGTYFDELTGKQENKDGTGAHRAETKRIFSDLDLFEARVEEIIKEMAKKESGILADLDEHCGDNDLDEVKEEVEELD